MSLKFESLEACKGKKADLWLASAALETIKFQIFNKNVPLLGMAGALPFDCMYVGQRLQDS